MSADNIFLLQVALEFCLILSVSIVNGREWFLGFFNAIFVCKKLLTYCTPASAFQLKGVCEE